jgi:hypothetical protein
MISNGVLMGFFYMIKPLLFAFDVKFSESPPKARDQPTVIDGTREFFGRTIRTPQVVKGSWYTHSTLEA